RALHSFPTRRSSDLLDVVETERLVHARVDLVLRDLPLLAVCAGKRVPGDRLLPEPKDLREAVLDAVGDERRSVVRLAAVEAQGRSEEHTSELQSREK